MDSSRIDGFVRRFDEDRSFERLSSVVSDITARDPQLRGFIAVDRDVDDFLGSMSDTAAGGPLRGVPIAVKDNIDTVGLGNTAGSILLQGVPVETDAPVVETLRRAGAWIVGKTNLSEWANFRSTRSSSGWSSVGGQTQNAVVPGRTPCGSSSGSATVVAAGLVPAAIGTETDGSIVCPASVQGVVGYKPAVGMVPTEGVVPVSPSQDSVGVIAGSVADAYAVAAVIQRMDDPAPAQGNVGKLRIGWIDPGDRAHPQVRDLLEWARRRWTARGATVVPISLDHARKSDLSDAEWTTLIYEFPRALEAYLRERRPACPYRDLAALAGENVARGERTHVHFGQEIWDAALAADRPTDDRYREARQLVAEYGRGGIDSVFAREGLDVVVGAANNPAWLIDHVNGDRHTPVVRLPIAAAGYPELTVPLGKVRGLPIGLSIATLPARTGRLFEAGFAWEVVRDARDL